jgi:hypothetical protein
VAAWGEAWATGGEAGGVVVRDGQGWRSEREGGGVEKGKGCSVPVVAWFPSFSPLCCDPLPLLPCGATACGCGGLSALSGSYLAGRARFRCGVGCRES